MTLYEILGVNPDASQDEIKAAFRQKSKTMHPDIAGPEAEEAFKAMSHAYSVLSDPERRQRYDETGADAMDNGERAAEAKFNLAVDTMITDILLKPDFDLTSTDVIATLVESLESDRIQILKQLSEAKRRQRRATTILERLTVTDDKKAQSPLHESLRRKLVQMDQAVAQFDEVIKTIDSAVELVQSHDYEFTAPPPPDFSRRPMMEMLRADFAARDSDIFRKALYGRFES